MKLVVPCTLFWSSIARIFPQVAKLLPFFYSNLSMTTQEDIGRLVLVLCVAHWRLMRHLISLYTSLLLHTFKCVSILEFCRELRSAKTKNCFLAHYIISFLNIWIFIFYIFSLCCFLSQDRDITTDDQREHPKLNFNQNFHIKFSETLILGTLSNNRHICCYSFIHDMNWLCRMLLFIYGYVYKMSVCIKLIEMLRVEL